MNITRTLNIIKVKAICYDPELKCEISKDLTFIGHYSNGELEKMIRKHPDVGIRRGSLIRDACRNILQQL